MPEPDRCAQVLGREHDAYETVGFRGVVRGPQLERDLMLLAHFGRLLVAPAAQVPDVEPMAVLAGDDLVDAEPVLEHVGRAPLAGDRDVVAEVPPEVVGEKLRAAVDLPLAEYVEAIVVKQKNSAWAAACARAHRAHVDGVGASMRRTRPAVARAPRQFLRLA